MNDKEYRIDGFVFTDIDDYYAAKQEAEIIEYIRANTDLEAYTEAVKTYHRLVEQNTLRTAVGLAFLKELQEKILREGIISKANLEGIRIEKNKAKHNSLISSRKNGAEDNQEQLAHYRIKLRNSRIISLFLLAIILCMLIIAIFSDRSVYTNYEKKILNKYSAWEEELKAREKVLEEAGE